MNAERKFKMWMFAMAMSILATTSLALMLAMVFMERKAVKSGTDQTERIIVLETETGVDSIWFDGYGRVIDNLKTSK